MLSVSAHPVVAVPAKVRRKKRREEKKGGEEGGEEAEDLTSLAKILDFSFTFKAVGPGTLVAAVFEDDFYVGEVEERMSSETALVNFMCRCAGKETVYKWPVSPDRCCIDEKFAVAAKCCQQMAGSGPCQGKMERRLYRSFMRTGFCISTEA